MSNSGIPGSKREGVSLFDDLVEVAVVAGGRIVWDVAVFHDEEVIDIVTISNDKFSLFWCNTKFKSRKVPATERWVSDRTPNNRTDVSKFNLSLGVESLDDVDEGGVVHFSRERRSFFSGSSNFFLERDFLGVFLTGRFFFWYFSMILSVRRPVTCVSKRELCVL